MACLLAIATAKPLDDPFADHADFDAVTPSSSAKSDVTTPQDAGTIYNLSYLQDSYPDKETIRDVPDGSPAKEKRSVQDDIAANKEFFDQIYKDVNRNVRRAQDDSSPPPTINLSALIGSVEDTLIHSAQSLADSNLTISTGNDTNAASIDSSTAIALPIDLTPDVSPANDDNDDSATTTIPLADDVTEKNTHEYESVIPLKANGNLSLLQAIALPQKDLELPKEDEPPTTLPTDFEPSENLTVVQSINSSLVSPIDSGVRVQEQQITILTGNTGIFSGIPLLQVNLTDGVLKGKDANKDDSSSSSSSSSSEESSKTGKQDCSKDEDSSSTEETKCNSDEKH